MINRQSSNNFVFSNWAFAYANVTSITRIEIVTQLSIHMMFGERKIENKRQIGRCTGGGKKVMEGEGRVLITICPPYRRRVSVK
jgi:hypothetical protein